MYNIKLTLLKTKSLVLTDGSSPVVLSVRPSSGAPKYIRTGVSCKPSYWDNKKRQLRNVAPNSKRDNAMLRTYLARAEEINTKYISQQKTLAFDELKKYVTGKKELNEVGDVYDYWNELIKRYEANQQIAYADKHRDARRIVKKLAPGLSKFSDWKPKHLEGIEANMRTNGSANGNISFVLRTFRTAWNRAIKDDIIDATQNPFKKHSISHLKSEYTPRYLTLEEMRSIIEFDCSTYPELQYGHRVFLFAYFARGMSFADIARLTWENNVRGDKIVYARTKSKSKITIGIIPALRTIIDAQRLLSPVYLFPVVSEEMTEREKIRRIANELKIINRQLKAIAAILGIDKPLTSYYARHSYAMHLRATGASDELISSALGHADLSTTKHYLERFGDETIDAATSLLQ